MATVNLGRVKPIYKGAYAAGTTYTPLDFVTYDGLTYFCILESTGNLPTNTTYWQMVVDGAAASAVTYDNGDSGLDATNVQDAIDEVADEKQDTLVSGTNIKTINSTSLLGSGDISMEDWFESYGQSIAVYGYQKLPSGLIIQWGTTTLSTGGYTPLLVSLPIAFPNAVLLTVGSSVSAGGSLGSCGSATTSSVYVFGNNAGMALAWIIIGY